MTPRAPLLLAILLGLPALARAQDIGALLKARQFDAAERAAAAQPDPVARKLVSFVRLQGGGSAIEISEFLAASPDWPAGALLQRRRDSALAIEPDDQLARRACDLLAPASPPATLRCGEVWLGKRGIEAIRTAWRAGIADQASETLVLGRYATELTPQDQWEHFTHLPANDRGAATRQLARLDGPHQQAGAALMAIRQGDPAGQDMAAALPASLRADPVLTLERARALRRGELIREAAEVWAAEVWAAEVWPASPATPQPASFWAERNSLARLLLRDGKDKLAYEVVARHGQTDEDNALDAEFLAGWIALRRLHDAAAAIPHFTTLSTRSQSVLTQGRAWYWLWRARAEAGQTAQAEAARQHAARYVLSYYGQLAAGDAAPAAIAAMKDPSWDQAAARAFAGREVARAAALLVQWGEPELARPFLMRLEDVAANPAERAMAAGLAMQLGQTEMAVAMVRRAGRYGTQLPGLGWPRPYPVPEAVIEPAFAWAIMRQESNFSPTAISGSGARGLMQLMPATAAAVAKQVGAGKISLAQLYQPDFNIRLGTRYLAGLMDRFADAMPLSAAGYNAGPGRVNQFLSQNGDPRGRPPETMIDWIELIPLNETRNYVQRVIENVVIYRARTGVSLGNPILHPGAVIAPPPGMTPTPEPDTAGG